MALSEAVCQSANLSAAYGRFRRFRGLWTPGVLMSSIAAAPVFPLLQLAEEIRGGRYRPHPPHTISIAKADGGCRELRIYMLRDRVAQRALLQVLQVRTDHLMSPFSFGYRPGRSPRDAIACIRTLLDSGLSWVVEADIERCFDSIPRAPLLKEVETRLHGPAAADLTARYLGWDGAEQGALTGIPQGSVLAPWLCNIYLWRLDDRMHRSGTAMVRFADDFVLLTATRGLAVRARDDCADAAASLRFRLHPLKTAITGAGEPFRFLGQWIDTARPLTAAPAAA